MPLSAWILGVVLAGLALTYGLAGLSVGSIVMISRSRGPVVVDGPLATPVSLSMMALGVFLHTYFYWRNHPRLELVGDLASLVALSALALCVLWFAYGVLSMV